MLRLSPRRPGRPLVIAHRGASGEMPENTMAAFNRALDQGADLIELDVQMTSDGVPVVVHDPTLDRTTNGQGLVSETSLRDLRQLRAEWAGQQGHDDWRVPTLEEVLRWALHRVPVAIEVKRDGPFYNPLVESVVAEMLRDLSMVDQTVVISFDHGVVKRIRDLCPEVATGVLFAGTPVDPVALADAAAAQALLPHWTSLSPGMVRSCHARGLAVSPWVVDDEGAMRWVLSLGVDALATNFPGRLSSLLSSSGD